jgi:hypothetical protein
MPGSNLHIGYLYVFMLRYTPLTENLDQPKNTNTWDVGYGRVSFFITAAVAVSRLTCHRNADKLLTPISRIFCKQKLGDFLAFV